MRTDNDAFRLSQERYNMYGLWMTSRGTDVIESGLIFSKELGRRRSLVISDSSPSQNVKCQLCDFQRIQFKLSRMWKLFQQARQRGTSSLQLYKSWSFRCFPLPSSILSRSHTHWHENEMFVPKAISRTRIKYSSIWRRTMHTCRQHSLFPKLQIVPLSVHGAQALLQEMLSPIEV